ncbi:tetratricopeptide repeat protein [Fulvivirgaceae bacterium BMA10]|uniref:Tetratricopeptide repeat protein n=1 Tax=Splendidivirga corallicola TaxID=3051826 RepID=A0ABT8KMT8_9BACT|nr:tetratricopeptide repeat protein [Fulvivirgaceae bacterium BMA10]
MNKIIVFFLFTTLTQISFAQTDKINLANEYYSNGDYTKALDLYIELARRAKNIPAIHKNYFDLLLTNSSYPEAEKYINRVIKVYPQNIYYNIDKGVLFKAQGRVDDADKLFNRVIESSKKEDYKTRITAQYFLNKRLTNYALKTFKEARKKSDDPYAYSIDMANIYRITNNKSMMIEEYLNYVTSQPANIEYVKNVLQNLLSEEEDLRNLETMLFDKVQKKPDRKIYSELLIWVNLQLKNFYGAFIQSRAYDKRFKTDGEKTMDIGAIAFENKDYKTTIKIFEYITKEYQNSDNYILARRYLIWSREEIVKNTFPVDNDEIRKLVNDYEKLVSEVGLNHITLEALRSEALLYAFYLNEKDHAIEILSRIINANRTGANLRAKCKLDLGDIFILTGEPWESTLLYSQVEKTHKEHPLGYEAKLRNAKLSYYKGEFSLAQSHLDILKLATSREISNDAISLSLLIKDNTILDTTDFAMKQYASIELLLFQNKKKEALDSLNIMLKEFPGHSLTDEIYWSQAKIYMELGEFEKSLELLNKIVGEYSYDILSDDAYFLTGTIYEDQLNDKNRAMEIYQDFLTKYPGSLFVAEARKRFRKLRGDLVN